MVVGIVSSRPVYGSGRTSPPPTKLGVRVIISSDKSPEPTNHRSFEHSTLAPNASTQGRSRVAPEMLRGALASASCKCLRANGCPIAAYHHITTIHLTVHTPLYPPPDPIESNFSCLTPSVAFTAMPNKSVTWHLDTISLPRTKPSFLYIRHSFHELPCRKMMKPAQSFPIKRRRATLGDGALSAVYLPPIGP